MESQHLICIFPQAHNCLLYKSVMESQLNKGETLIVLYCLLYKSVMESQHTNTGNLQSKNCLLYKSVMESQQSSINRII